MIIKIKNSYKVMKVTLIEIDSKNNYNPDVSYKLLKHRLKPIMDIEEFQREIRIINNAIDKYNYYGNRYNSNIFSDISLYIQFDLNKSYRLNYYQL